MGLYEMSRRKACNPWSKEYWSAQQMTRMGLNTEIKLRILSLEVDHWLGTKSHEQGGSPLFWALSTGQKQSRGSGYWAVNVRPVLQKSYHQWVRTELWGPGWAKPAAGSDDITGARRSGISLGTKAGAGSLSEALLLSTGCFSLEQPPALAGMEQGHTPLSFLSRLFSSPSLFSFRGS